MRPDEWDALAEEQRAAWLANAENRRLVCQRCGAVGRRLQNSKCADRADCSDRLAAAAREELHKLRAAVLMVTRRIESYHGVSAVERTWVAELLKAVDKGSFVP